MPSLFSFNPRVTTFVMHFSSTLIRVSKQRYPTFSKSESKLSPLHHNFVGERARVRGHQRPALTPTLSRVTGEGEKLLGINGYRLRLFVKAIEKSFAAEFVNDGVIHERLGRHAFFTDKLQYRLHGIGLGAGDPL